MSTALEERDEQLTYPQLQSVALLRACMGDDADGFPRAPVPAEPTPAVLRSRRPRIRCTTRPRPARRSRMQDVYFGISPRDRQSGTNEDVEQCHVLFADLDYDEALGALDRLIATMSSTRGELPCRLGRSDPERAFEAPRLLGADRAGRSRDRHGRQERLAATLASDPVVHDPRALHACRSRTIFKDGSRREVRVLKGNARSRFALEDVVGKLPALSVPSPSMTRHSVGIETPSSVNGRPRAHRAFRSRTQARWGESERGLLRSRVLGA